ncbi:MAG: hypothetical protein RLY93_12620 [Sumerlaeia bacterium]
MPEARRKATRARRRWPPLGLAVAGALVLAYALWIAATVLECWPIWPAEASPYDWGTMWPPDPSQPYYFAKNPNLSWGWEQFLMFPAGVRWASVVALALAAGGLLAAGRRPVAWLRRLEGASREIGAHRLGPALMATIFVAVAVLFRQRRFWGDWALFSLKPLVDPFWTIDTPLPFWRSPMAYGTQEALIATLHGALGLPASMALRVGPLAAGLVWVFGLWEAARQLFPGARWRGLLFFAVVLSYGLTVLAFGYFEAYPFSNAILLWYVASSLRALRERRMPYAAGFWMGVACLYHPQNLLYAPGLALPWALAAGGGLAWNRAAGWLRRIAGGLGVWALMLVPVGLFLLVQEARGMGLETIAIGFEGTVFVPGEAAVAVERWRALLQVSLRVLPLFPILAVCAVLLAGRLPWRNARFVWLALQVPFAAWILLVIENRLPLWYDWDLMSPHLTMLGLWCAAGLAGLRYRVRWVVLAAILVVVFQVWVLGFWLGRNAVADPQQRAAMEFYGLAY